MLINIAGLQKMTLLDYPGKVACTVFLQGCNFRCPFCHNGEILDGSQPGEMTAEELLTFLKKRQGLLEGVCITGGEPTLQKDLPELLAAIKDLGYSVKLDTNGFRPDVLRELVTAGLVDYVAMDIKNSPDRYGETAGLPRMDVSRIEESIRFLMEGSLPYEFRTTVVEEFHDEQAMEAIGKWTQHIVSGKKMKNYFLQPYVDRETVLNRRLHTPDKEKIRRFAAILEPYAEKVEIRGMD